MIEYFRSIIEQDKSSVVICNLDHEIIYMNKSAIKNYKNRGGVELIGKSLLNCHGNARFFLAYLGTCSHNFANAG